MGELNSGGTPPRTAPLGDLLGVDAASARALRHFQELARPLHTESDAKALLQRYAETVRLRFGARRLGCVRLPASGDATAGAAKRRSLGVDGLEELPLEVMLQLAGMIRANGELATEAADGCAQIEFEGEAFQAAVIADVKSDGGSLVAWSRGGAGASPLGGALDAALIDLLTRTLQNEARWLRRLDGTQALLYRDDLTGLYNTRYFEVALDGELRRAERFQMPFCLMFVDLDGFKPVNDEHGHLSGSSVLRQVAEVIKDAVREIDIPIRYGGDEFVVVLIGATCAKGELAAERVRRRIEQTRFRTEDACQVRLTASIGLAAYPDHGHDRPTLLRLADEMMYQSKKTGKNKVTVVKDRAARTATPAPALQRRGES